MIIYLLTFLVMYQVVIWLFSYLISAVRSAAHLGFCIHKNSAVCPLCLWPLLYFIFVIQEVSPYIATTSLSRRLQVYPSEEVLSAGGVVDPEVCVFWDVLHTSHRIETFDMLRNCENFGCIVRGVFLRSRYYSSTAACRR